MQRSLIIALLALTACGSDPVDPGPTGPVPGDAQTPPTADQAVLDAWLAAGTYKDWACEAMPHSARRGSGHTRNRICTNTLQSTHSATTAFPVGAAAVKELIDEDGNVDGFAVYVRTGDGDGGDQRFWYEVINGAVVAIGYGHATCTGCHQSAPKDYVFTQVR